MSIQSWSSEFLCRLGLLFRNPKVRYSCCTEGRAGQRIQGLKESTRGRDQWMNHSLIWFNLSIDFFESVLGQCFIFLTKVSGRSFASFCTTRQSGTVRGGSGVRFPLASWPASVFWGAWVGVYMHATSTTLNTIPMFGGSCRDGWLLQHPHPIALASKTLLLRFGWLSFPPFTDFTSIHIVSYVSCRMSFVVCCPHLSGHAGAWPSCSDLDGGPGHAGHA